MMRGREREGGGWLVGGGLERVWEVVGVGVVGVGGGEGEGICMPYRPAVLLRSFSSQQALDRAMSLYFLFLFI